MPSPHEAAEVLNNSVRILERSQRVMQEFIGRQKLNPCDSAENVIHIGQAFMEMFGQLMSDPSKLLEQQMGLAQDYIDLWQNTTQRFMGMDAPPAVPTGKDKRFADSAWEENAVFDWIKQSYLLTARWMQNTVKDTPGLDRHTLQKVDFYTRQFVDAMAPSNFLITNPEVLKKTIDSNGENLVKGLENLIGDLERGQGKLQISQTDLDAFAVGRNLGITPGKVIYQNDLMQLIQYEPMTAKVYKKPLLVIPAWINKYYILDLQPQNSYVAWLVKQGYTVFVISWVNPDERHAEKTFDDYLLEGPLAALGAIEKATGEKEVAAIGYCLGGTLLSIAMSYLASKGKKSISSATYLTTMVDFSEAGELSVFIDEEQLVSLEKRMSDVGYLEGAEMGMTFSMLRANDLIWSFVVNNYLLGKEPFPFDLLYWNSDSTRMPARMHSFYLRNMYQKNLLVKPNGLKIAGVPVNLRKIEAPSCIVSARDDHIAPWKSTYAATQIYGGDIKFILGASGHIAGIVNPPAKNKYSYWTNGAKLNPNPDEWFKHAKEHPGSWWTAWHEWQKKYAGPQVPSRTIGGGKLKPLENAPGKYVKARVV